MSSAAQARQPPSHLGQAPGFLGTWAIADRFLNAGTRSLPSATQPGTVSAGRLGVLPSKQSDSISARVQTRLGPKSGDRKRWELADLPAKNYRPFPTRKSKLGTTTVSDARPCSKRNRIDFRIARSYLSSRCRVLEIYCPVPNCWRWEDASVRARPTKNRPADAVTASAV